MGQGEATPEARLLGSARGGDPAAFERLVAGYRRELLAHCYRMLGSVQDAEDALQDSLLGAWRGIAGFEGRSSIRSWLYRISTNACLRLIARRPRRILSPEHGPPVCQTADLGEAVAGPVWLEPFPDRLPDGSGGPEPEAAYLRRESVELAFVAALQHLPATQRAVLLLREVLGFSAAEAAQILDTTPASVNSALQRARRTVDERKPATTQQAELADLGAPGRRELVDAFVGAWERADVVAMLDLLSDDARFTMPPLPAWFLGRSDIGRFFSERVFADAWRLVPVAANGQLTFACYQGGRGGGRLRLGAINVVTVHASRIAAMDGFLDPDLHRYFGLPEEVAATAPPPPGGG